MGCLSDFTLKGITLDCNPVLAGIKRVYLGYNDQLTITPDPQTQTATIHPILTLKILVLVIQIADVT